MRFETIDINDVMERLDGSEELFKILINKFYTQYSEYYKSIEELLEKDNYKEAYELTHLIKGVSGNLGMKKLHKSSGLLCEVIKNKDDENKMDAILQFKVDFIKVVEEIKEYI